MSRVFERAVVAHVTDVLGATHARTPDWLLRPGRDECGERWPLVCEIYNDLTGMQLPNEMRKIERRTVDCVLIVDGSRPRVLEVDESQHFNLFRARTLEHYASHTNLAFDPNLWIAKSQAKTKLESGGFGRPMPPLFPGDAGRHRQRAFRDALCDILPPLHGFAPTLRIADFEVRDWINGDTAREEIRRLLSTRMTLSIIVDPLGECSPTGRGDPQ